MPVSDFSIEILVLPRTASLHIPIGILTTFATIMRIRQDMDNVALNIETVWDILLLTKDPLRKFLTVSKGINSLVREEMGRAKFYIPLGKVLVEHDITRFSSQYPDTNNADILFHASPDTKIMLTVKRNEDGGQVR